MLDLDTIAPWARPAFDGTNKSGAHVVYNLDEATYHASRGLVSKSALDQVNDSLEKYRYWQDHPENPTAAMIEGSAFHCAVLEPDLFASRYAIVPDFGDMRSSTNRAKRDGWIEDHVLGSGLIALKLQQVELIRAMAHAVRNHADVRLLLRNATTEVSVAWTWMDDAGDADEEGIPMKSRADGTTMDFGGVAFDLKRALSASRDGFLKAMLARRYHVQDAIYTRGLRAGAIPVKNFVFIACEPEPPYAVGIWQAPQPMRLVGEDTARRDLKRLQRARATGYFPGYTQGVQELEAPGWFMARAEQEGAKADAEEEASAKYRSV